MLFECGSAQLKNWNILTAPSQPARAAHLLRAHLVPTNLGTTTAR